MFMTGAWRARIKMRKIYLAIVFSMFCLAVSLTGSSAAQASSLPPWPTIYSGNITVNGAVPRDGALVTAKMGDYTSQSVAVLNGRYAGLAVGGPDSTFFGRTITFHLDDLVIAEETDVFAFNQWIVINSSFDLTFPAYPTPTPTPTSVPTATPTATPIPSPTPTPEIPQAMIITGVVDVLNGDPADLEGKLIVARVGSYFSEPVALTLSTAFHLSFLEFENLVIDPRDYKYAGGDLEFFVHGLEASANPTIYESAGRLDVAVTVSLPDTPVVPVEVPPTMVPVVPTAVMPTVAVPTPLPTESPTTTAVPTQVIPSATPVVLVVTATPSAELPLVDVEGAGGCNAPSDVSGVSGAANALMLVAPLMLIGAYKGVRRRKEVQR